MIAANVANIPAALTRVPQWVNWKLEERQGKPTKPPYCPRTGRYASVNDPTTFSTYEEAVDALPNYDGLGFVLTKDDDFLALDLDHCRDVETGALTPSAQSIVTTMRAYTEVSPSGTGLRLLARGRLPEDVGVRKIGHTEFYQYGKYFTITGAHVDETPWTLEERTAAVAQVYAQYAPAPAPKRVNGHAPLPAPPVTLDDHQLIEKMCTAKNGAKPRALWQGDWSAYPSQSEADMALCQHLAFWCDRDEPRVDRLFRASGLMREKWVEKHYGDGRTYGAETISKACAGCAESYTGRSSNATTGDAPPTESASAPDPSPQAEAEPVPEPTALLGMGLGQFLGLDLPQPTALIEGILSSTGGGWIGGEEKLGKTIYVLHEALSLALGTPVCGQFAVPARVRVLFIEEEDPPVRSQGRLAALLRGLGLDPTDSLLRAELDGWFRMANWTGFTLDEPSWLDQLAQTCAAFQPTVVYLDVLRKLTTKDLNKADQAGALLKSLDDLRRTHGTLFRVVAHNRKVQGAFRAGRGSQELGGSYQLGAWGENSLFFEPIGKTQGAVKVTIQSKDGAPLPAFGLRLDSEGPAHCPTCLRVTAEDLSQTSAAEALKEKVFEALGSLPPEPAVSGQPGVSRDTICATVQKSSYPVRTALQALLDEGKVLVMGKASKQKKLYVVKPS